MFRRLSHETADPFFLEGIMVVVLLDRSLDLPFPIELASINETSIDKAVHDRCHGRLDRWLGSNRLDIQRQEYLVLRCLYSWSQGYDQVASLIQREKISEVTQRLMEVADGVQSDRETDPMFFSPSPYPDLVGLVFLDFEQIAERYALFLPRLLQFTIRSCQASKRDYLGFVEAYVQHRSVNTVLSDLAGWLAGFDHSIDPEVIERVGLWLIEQNKLSIEDLVQAQERLWYFNTSLPHRLALSRVVDEVWFKVSKWKWFWVWSGRKYKLY